jgi:hypothetical protein
VPCEPEVTRETRTDRPLQDSGLRPGLYRRIKDQAGQSHSSPATDSEQSTYAAESASGAAASVARAESESAFRVFENVKTSLIKA